MVALHLESLSPDSLIGVIKSVEGLTTKQLAQKLKDKGFDVSYSTLSAVEGRRKPCGQKLLLALHNIYGIDLNVYAPIVEAFNYLVKQSNQ